MKKGKKVAVRTWIDDVAYLTNGRYMWNGMVYNTHSEAMLARQNYYAKEGAI
jgi:hypothetical protein